MILILLAFQYAVCNSEANIELHNQIPNVPERQGNALFVEDNAGFGPVTHPDSLWHTLLTNLYGAGNFGWFGPTTNKYQDGPDLQTMQAYNLVIWNNYDHYGQPLPLSPTLTAVDQANITDYIASGGKFWFIAQDASYSGVPIAFLQNNFGLADYIPDIINVVSTHIQGLVEAASPQFFITADYASTTVFYPDELIPSASAHHIVKDTDHNFYPGILRDDSIASYWTIDGRLPVPASVWEQLATDMLNVFGAGIAEQSVFHPVQGIWIEAKPTAFRDYTLIQYSIPTAGHVSIIVFDILGSSVDVIASQHHDQGIHAITWYGKNAFDDKVADGIYFVRLCYGNNATTTKVIILE